ncbi:small-conductance mechanosensitive channel [Hydrogenobaculum sp. SN]|nr:MscS Mechanosensitive ion channel [Hydrogenobaculum sp. 3684]AEG46113.1 MscS Mechanosensitive ion channel [Hydrogenobaculum sp. SHO]AGG14758.1 MscS Mechanosensitive ion channel [Hydrogenobaculum sp. HO]AGH93055.1 small-conductance mechanosensitive channel [Hydrogenobaculum sp. SN]
MLLELLGHVFKIIEEYGLLVFCFSFWSILFFCIGFLIGISLNAVFKRFKTTNKISISPFLIGIWLAFLVAYIFSDYLYITKKDHVVIKHHLIIDRTIIFFFVIINFLILSKIIGLILSKIIGKIIDLFIKPETDELNSPILKDLIVLFVFIIGLFIAFQIIGISITTLITTLGVGTAVIGFVVRDTLSNLLSGFYILVSKNIRVGDYIKFDEYEGYVKDIHWHTTHIRTLSKNIIAVPNSKLTSSVITNYNLTYEHMSVVFSFSVGYKENLERVEKLLIEIAKEVVNKVESADKSYEPVVRYRSFGSSGIELILVVRVVKEFQKQYFIVHELIKAIKKRFEEENIEIPYQTINVIIKDES